MKFTSITGPPTWCRNRLTRRATNRTIVGALPAPSLCPWAPSQKQERHGHDRYQKPNQSRFWNWHRNATNKVEHAVISGRAAHGRGSPFEYRQQSRLIEHAGLIEVAVGGIPNTHLHHQARPRRRIRQANIISDPHPRKHSARSAKPCRCRSRRLQAVGGCPDQ